MTVAAKIKPTEPTDEEYDRDEFVRFVADLNDALRTIEVLGQIVKTFAGQLEAEPKKVLIEECYNLGLRVLNELLGFWKEDPEKIIQEIIDGILQSQANDKEVKNMSRDELTKLVKRFIFVFSEYTTFGIIKRISHAVGSPQLQLSYDRLVDEAVRPSYAVRLLDASIRLDIAKISSKRVVDLHKAFQDSVFADHILKHLVLHYFRLFHTDVSIRQALCQALEISIEQGRQRSLSGSDHKRLPPRR